MSEEIYSNQLGLAFPIPRANVSVLLRAERMFPGTQELRQHDGKGFSEGVKVPVKEHR